ncbi:hypothetical protein [Thermospira aquatica]|uniref:Uncharacterized protein n=1 Tax=Thermospira aquatica TaxID=2828656 RepID=A0AAX3BBU8_9SPIR|nr:hypothetical protein [Thermospira aquatica]URA09782.1 hypothetical protein KDW03_09885 [Thermospira aquatica]
MVLLVGVIGGMYGSLARLSGLGVYYSDQNWLGASWIIDDPILVPENGALIYRLPNEVGWEPFAYISTGNWNDSYAYGVINTEWVSVGLFINPNQQTEDYLESYSKVNAANPPT